MSRPVTLFTGQWADLPLEKLAPLAYEMGYDGLELACWGDHFDVDAAMGSKKYIKEKWELLSDHGLTCYSISSHLVGQAIAAIEHRQHDADDAQIRIEALLDLFDGLQKLTKSF